MLRPVSLLPVARLTPPGGLLTPRSAVRVSPARLGPATRRSDAYRDGTLTRWTSAARGRARLRLREAPHVFVTAHHGANVAEQRSSWQVGRTSSGLRLGDLSA